MREVGDRARRATVSPEAMAAIRCWRSGWTEPLSMAGFPARTRHVCGSATSKPPAPSPRLATAVVSQVSPQFSSGLQTLRPLHRPGQPDFEHITADRYRPVLDVMTWCST